MDAMTEYDELAELADELKGAKKRAKQLKQQVEELEDNLRTVLDVAVERGQRLGYEDEDYRIWLKALAQQEEA